jgi:hypothetical protein
MLVTPELLWRGKRKLQDNQVRASWSEFLSIEIIKLMNQMSSRESSPVEEGLLLTGTCKVTHLGQLECGTYMKIYQV